MTPPTSPARLALLVALAAGLPTAAHALEPPTTGVAIMPTPEHVLIDLANVPEDIAGPGHCLYRVTQGERTFTHRLDFDDMQDAWDLSGVCVVANSDFEDLVWPGPIAVEAELEVAGTAIAVTPSRYDPATDGLFDPATLRAQLTAAGWAVTVGEAAQDFGSVHYQEWFLERGGESASIATLVGTPDRFTPADGTPPQVGCATPEGGDPICRYCVATFCADIVPYDEAGQHAHDALLSAMRTLGAAVEPAPAVNPPAPTPPRLPAEEACDPPCAVYEVCAQGECHLLE